MITQLWNGLDHFHRRIVIGKLVGLIAGGVAVCTLCRLYDGWQVWFWGLWGWYVLLGFMIAIGGLWDFHPLWKSWRLPWWFRGTIIGGFMGFIITSLLYGEFERWLVTLNFYPCPWTWGIAEGIFWGLVLDGLMTRYWGEGKDLMKKASAK